MNGSSITRHFLTFFGLALSTLPPLSASHSTITMTQHNKLNYYHAQLRLTPENTQIKSSATTAGGDFTLLIHRNALPPSLSVQALNAPYIALNMPATKMGTPGANLFINEKKQLFENIKVMKAYKHSNLSVIVEFNPNLKVISNYPVQWKLTKPAIRFRHAYGRYINYLGPLKAEDTADTP